MIVSFGVTISSSVAVCSAAADLTVAKLNALMGGKYKFTAVNVAGSTTAPPLPDAVGEVPKTWFETYRPLLLIAGYIGLAAFAGTTAVGRAGFDWSVWMTNAMAGFFLVFSAFKFLDLKGFATAYASYDLGAKAWAPWGTISLSWSWGSAAPICSVGTCR